MSVEEEMVQEYREYLERFDSTIGESEFGTFVKHNGRLIKKLRFDEFEPLYKEYYEIAKTYYESLDRGDTINDLVVKLLRDRATDLLKPSPVSSASRPPVCAGRRGPPGSTLPYCCELDRRLQLVDVDLAEREADQL